MPKSEFEFVRTPRGGARVITAHPSNGTRGGPEGGHRCCPQVQIAQMHSSSSAPVASVSATESRSSAIMPPPYGVREGVPLVRGVPSNLPGLGPYDAPTLIP
jgi:hypothetical protein